MRAGLIIVGMVLTLVGAVWTFQGLGYLEGSAMTGDTFWATVGPIVAGLGVALVWVSWRRSGSR